MGGFVSPFVPSPAWPQDIVFAGSSCDGVAFPGDETASSSLDKLHDQLLLLQGSSGLGFATDVDGEAFPGGETALPSLDKLHEQLLLLQNSAMGFETEHATMAGELGFIMGGSNESSGSDQFLVGEQPVPPLSMAWPTAYANASSLAGEETPPQSFGFGRIPSNGDLLQEANGNKFQQPPLHDDTEFNTGKLLSFTPGQQVSSNIDSLPTDPKGFSSLSHVDLSSLVPGSLKSLNATGAAHINGQSTKASSGMNGSVSSFLNQFDAHNGNGSGGDGTPKPRARARRGQATDPHSIAERLRREKISDRMKNLQELVPNSNKTDKASMLDEIIDYIRFLQMQAKVLSMSRLGSAPLLAESQSEVSELLVTPRSGGGGVQVQLGKCKVEDDDGEAFENEVVHLMESNMTAAMQYLQSKGLCLMPVALASVISTKNGTSSAAVRPDGGSGRVEEDVKRMLDAMMRRPLGGNGKETKANPRR